MKALVHPAVVAACVLACCGTTAAKGSGGHGSGGHGGHGSGGHSSGGHAGGGHASGGSHGSSGGHASGGASRQTSSRRTAGFVVGTAVPRTPFSSVQGPLPFTRLAPFYAGPGFGYGHRLFYDPFLFGSGFNYPSYAYGYRPRAAYSGFGYASDPFDREGPIGSIRLIVEPTYAAVFVDGYYAGVVDDFDGHFQHLDLTARPHHLEISAPGYQPLEIDVAIQPRHRIDYRGTLISSRP